MFKTFVSLLSGHSSYFVNILAAWTCSCECHCEWSHVIYLISSIICFKMQCGIFMNHREQVCYFVSQNAAVVIWILSHRKPPYARNLKSIFDCLAVEDKGTNPLKCWEPLTQCHRITSQKIWIFFVLGFYKRLEVLTAYFWACLTPSHSITGHTIELLTWIIWAIYFHILSSKSCKVDVFFTSASSCCTLQLMKD
jgi:hypothetical protein